MTDRSRAGYTGDFNRRAIPEGAEESRWNAKDGWSIRRIDWPALDAQAQSDARGSVLFMPGRGDIYEKYLETLDGWHRQGWNVTASDWRGQGGSGRLTEQDHVGHSVDFAHWVEDFAQLYAEWKASRPGPHVLIAHSMGGHLIGRALIEQRADPDAVVLVAPMLGLHGLGLPPMVGHSVARGMRKMRGAKTAAWKVSEKPGSAMDIRQSLLTNDADRYLDEVVWWEKRPELKLGPASWGWVAEAYRSTRMINAPGQWEKVKAPVLLLGTSNDQLVRFAAIEDAANRIPNSERLFFGKECAHEILREADGPRDKAMAAITDFLDRHAPALAKG